MAFLQAEHEGLLLMELMEGDLASKMRELLPGGQGRLLAWHNRCEEGGHALPGLSG
jgi:hypothetical protein